MADLTLVIPWDRSRDRHRRDAFRYTAAFWRAALPGVPTVIGRCPPPWRKAVAVREAVARACSERVLIVDADVIVPGIERALDLDGWVTPHHYFYRLTEEATARVIEGWPPELAARVRSNLARAPYNQFLTGGAVLLPRDLALDVPGDPRFVGWGGQDWSWGQALRTLVGEPRRAHLVAYHLWHPPQPRRSGDRGSPENEALRQRYANASRDPKRMRALVDEAKAHYPERSDRVHGG
jgi:hypothetical protein